MESDRERWNRKYEERGIRKPVLPNPRLVKWVTGLRPGIACDLAMGLGQNLRFLAGLGWKVIGIEISDLALLYASQSLRSEEERENGERILLVQADIAQRIFNPGSLDLVVCSYYLDRELAPWIASLPRPGGHVFFESYDQGHRRYRPDFPEEYCLRMGEMRTLFPGYRIEQSEESDTGKASTQAFLAARPLLPPRGA